VEVHSTFSRKIKVRYEHVIFIEKMFRSFFASLWAKIYSLWTFAFSASGITRKKKMVETINLNVLVVPVSAESITKENIIVLKIPLNDSVFQLKPMTKELWPSLQKVDPNEINLKKSDGAYQSLSIELEQFKKGEFTGCEEISPYGLISKHFPSQPPNDRIHVVVTIKRQQ
jgi:hypothetical protein